METSGFLLLQASPGAGYGNLIFIALIFIVFYFFLIRPQSKRQKEQRQFVDDLEKGDEVVTAGGIIGRINKIEDDIITLEVSTKVYLRVMKSVISKDMTDGLQKKEQK
ncbi:MAG: preprotein translocase subunit YajC [Saprospiraceae bacterium]|nr:preprotein translocase subunit YajC [Saprospiraceae bacterium]MCB0625921.1 preprotein translocase subunit YajC [Saprospiraceae bacterium]MCB0676728.1 preprotein translocase subunit YajC [Saprospiraceae bacterium]MCB0683901.1 preprotein translocase subunit YajC [Saprospiraceae bacterium]